MERPEQYKLTLIKEVVKIIYIGGNTFMLYETDDNPVTIENEWNSIRITVKETTIYVNLEEAQDIADTLAKICLIIRNSQE
jgi:hypothetical protein